MQLDGGFRSSSGSALITAAWLLHAYGTSTAVSCYLVVIALICLGFASLLRDPFYEDYAAHDKVNSGATGDPVFGLSPSVAS